MSEPTVTIKLTKTELETLIEMMGRLPDEVLPVYKSVLRKQIVDIKEKLDEEIHKAVIDKKASEESFKEQTEMETNQRICVPCED